MPVAVKSDPSTATSKVAARSPSATTCGAQLSRRAAAKLCGTPNLMLKSREGCRSAGSQDPFGTAGLDQDRLRQPLDEVPYSGLGDPV
jgi:hypothetical protein